MYHRHQKYTTSLWLISKNKGITSPKSTTLACDLGNTKVSCNQNTIVIYGAQPQEPDLSKNKMYNFIHPWFIFNERLCRTLLPYLYVNCKNYRIFWHFLLTVFRWFYKIICRLSLQGIFGPSAVKTSVINENCRFMLRFTQNSQNREHWHSVEEGSRHSKSLFESGVLIPLV